LLAQPFFQLFRAIAVGAGPRFLTVQVPAIFARVGIFNAKQLKIFFPVRAFFSERGRAKTNFDPGHRVVGCSARVLHIPEIFIAGNRPAAQCLFIDCSSEIRFTPGFDACFYQITHGESQNLTQSRKDAKGTANGHKWGTRIDAKNRRRGVAFRVLARTGVDAVNSLSVLRLERRDALNPVKGNREWTRMYAKKI
jgi:hypothetical protein